MIILIGTISIFLCLFAGFAKAVMDLSSQGAFKKPWWNKFESADNKNHMVRPWNQYDRWIVRIWLKFMRWSFRNWLVAFTDGWHLFQFFFLNSLFISIGLSWWVYPNDPWMIIELAIFMRLSFWIFYKSKYMPW